MGKVPQVLRQRRVAVRPGFDSMDVALPSGAPTRTADGEPWVRWAKYGSYSGWLAVGSRENKMPAGKLSFWESTFLVACACTGGNLDQVHCCGRGVMALGGLGVTLRSGYAQLLLHSCLMAQPARFVEIMAPVMHVTGVVTKVTDKSPSGVALADDKGHLLLTEEDMRQAVMLGTDSVKWTGPQKARAQLWVSCCSKLLRDERMDVAQMTFAEEVMPALMTELTKTALKWPRHGVRDSWQYTHEQQLLWAVALILALEDEHETERLVASARDDVHSERAYSAAATLLQMQTLVARDGYEAPFQQRFATSVRMLSELLGVKLEAEA